MDPTLKFDSGPGAVGVRITVYNEVDGKTTDLLFRQLPVRIGRNTLNDLVLNHPYVSQWHAVIGFQRAQLVLMQVGSSNKVQVGGRRLGVNEEVRVTGQEAIRIVPFRLNVQTIPLPDKGAAPQETQAAMLPPGRTDGGDQRALEQLALRIIDRLSTRFLGRTLTDPEQLAAFGSRLERTLDVFVRCFIALQKGQQQFREALDIHAFGGSGNAVEQITSATELGAALLGRSGAIKELEHAFKNQMVHQVALLNGLMAGVRTLLDKLSPQTVAREASQSRRSPKAAQLWQTYEEIHSNLAEEDNETFETIFGRQFGKAYAKLLADRDKPNRRDKPKRSKRGGRGGSEKR